jgi:hypothetical protein
MWSQNMETIELPKAIVFLSYALNCDNRVLDSVFQLWPPRPNQLLFWIYTKLLKAEWKPRFEQKQCFIRFLSTPCEYIAFDCRFENAGRAVLLSTRFEERTDLWILRLTDITGASPNAMMLKATWQVAKKAWLLGYNDHTEWGFKVYATEWLK